MATPTCRTFAKVLLGFIGYPLTESHGRLNELGGSVAADALLDDLDLLVGEVVEVVDDLVDQLVGASDLRVEFVLVALSQKFANPPASSTACGYLLTT